MDLSTLNEKQLEAVKHIDHPLLVIAGAGSGKTHTMITRIAYMIESGVLPENILAVTFTNKAAKEMQERAVKMVGEEASKATISTFHSFCARFLRNECNENTRFKKSFSIIDDSDSKKIIESVAKDFLGDISRQDLSRKVWMYYSWICKLKSELVEPNHVKDLDSWLAKNCMGEKPKLPPYVDFDRAQSLTRKIALVERKNFIKIYSEYEKELVSNNVVDFESLITETIKMLINNNELLGKYQDKYKYIIIDEYQDTNHSQYILSKLLAAKYQNIAVVGDDAQSIYAFRNADIRNILNFEKNYPNAKVVKLEQNYRSTSNILDKANMVISHNLNQRKKKLWTGLGDGHPVKYSVYQDTKEEAQEIIRKIVTLVHLGQYHYSDFTILCRINAQSRVFEDFFVREKIPYDIIGGFSFYQRKEIKLLCSYINSILNPDNDLEIKEIINNPRRGIGETTINKCVQFAAEKKIKLMESLRRCDEYLSGASQKKISGFVALYDELTAKKDAYDTGVFISCLVEDLGLEEYFSKEGDESKENRMENVKEFMEMAWEFQAVGGTLERFIENIVINQQETASKEKENTDRVKIMTIHASKGLEFPVVFLIGCEDNMLPYSKSKEEPDGEEEERRLCYVAITRAKERLYISRVIERRFYNQQIYNAPSVFLYEMELEDKKQNRKELFMGVNPFKLEV